MFGPGSAQLRLTRDGVTAGLERVDYVLIVLLLTAISFPLLYIFRHVDDNALTSWRWVFAGGPPTGIFVLILLGTALSFLFSGIHLPERRQALFLILLSWCVVLPLWNMPEVIPDASRYFLQAKNLELYGMKYFIREWGNDIKAWTDLPVIPVLYGLIFRYLGEARPYIQCFTTLFFSLTVLLTYLIGRTLWNREAGLHAGLMLMGIPYLLTQVPLMLVDVPTMFLLTCSLYAFLKALEKGGPVLITLSASIIFLTAFSKYSAWMMLSVLPVATLIRPPEDRKRTFYRAAAVAMVAAIPSAALLLCMHDLIGRQMALLGVYQLQGLARWQEGFISTFLFQTHPFVSILAACAVFSAFMRRDRKFLVAGWFVVIVFILQIKRIRYIVPLFPLLALMASYGLNLIEVREVRRAVAFGIAAVSAIIAHFGFLPFLHGTSSANLRDAGRYIGTLRCEQVEVRALPQRSSSGNTWAAAPVLDLFTDKKIIYRQTPVNLPEEGLRRSSSLRFTWELGVPRFYVGGKGDSSVKVVISDEAMENFPFEEEQNGGKMRLMSRFVVASGVFRYKTFVSIFGEDCPE